MMISVFDRVENTVEKGENAGYQHFLLFPQCFPKLPLKASAEAFEKSSRWLRKESCVSTGVRKPRNTCVMTLAVKVVLNHNTTN